MSILGLAVFLSESHCSHFLSLFLMLLIILADNNELFLIVIRSAS